MSDLPKEYDVIIAGTGLTESILSAALSRIGKTVLHIDRNQFYGGEFSAHSLSSLIEWTDNLKKVNSTTIVSETSESNIDTVKCNNDLNNYYYDIEYKWNTKFDENIKENLLKQSRKFNLDLSPNIFYSRGLLIELLISSDVAKYCEFKNVTQILTKRSNRIVEQVPTSRSEVFKSSKLSMIEKRVMMQFVQSCLKDNDFDDLIDKDNREKISFKEFINGKKLPESISHYLINAVAMCPNDSDTAYKGLKETKKFLTSVGRFGESAFLYSLYGSSELTQCFCRMSAVFGGLFYLNMTIDNLFVDKNKNIIESILTKSEEQQKEEFKFNCKHLIIDSSFIPLNYLNKNDFNQKQISRCILITDKSIYNNKDNQSDHISCLFYPISHGSTSDIYIIESSYSSQCCPQGYYVVYMFSQKSTLTARENFQDCINTLFSSDDSNEIQLDETKPNILFSYYFSHLDSNYLIENCINKEINIPNNLYIVSGAKCQLDYDSNIIKAKEIFNKICPGEEFLPKPPDQEDIIFDHEQEEKFFDNSNNPLTSETKETNESQTLNKND